MQSVPDIWKGNKRIITPGGEQEMLCLSEQGLYFFLGRSDKPKALPYQMWVVGNVIPSIRKTGNYITNPVVPDIRINGAIQILERAGIKDNQLVLALDKMYRKFTGESVLLTAGIELEAPIKEQALNPTQIAEILGIGKGNQGARIVNTLLLNAGYQHRVGKNWEPTELGKPYAYVVDTNKIRSDGTPVIQVKWYTSILDIVKKLAQEISTGMKLAQAV